MGVGGYDPDERYNRDRKKAAERKPRKLNLERAAMQYLGRYPCSRAHFLFVMRRKIDRSLERVSQEDLELLATAMQDRGLLDDELFARGVANSYHRRGQSLSRIRLKLREKKLNDAEIDIAIEALVAEHESKHDADLDAALRIARRKKLGRWSESDSKLRAKQKQKDLAGD